MQRRLNKIYCRFVQFGGTPEGVRRIVFFHARVERAASGRSACATANPAERRRGAAAAGRQGLEGAAAPVTRAPQRTRAKPHDPMRLSPLAPTRGQAPGGRFSARRSAPRCARRPEEGGQGRRSAPPAAARHSAPPHGARARGTGSPRPHQPRRAAGGHRRWAGAPPPSGGGWRRRTAASPAPVRRAALAPPATLTGRRCRHPLHRWGAAAPDRRAAAKPGGHRRPAAGTATARPAPAATPQPDRRRAGDAPQQGRQWAPDFMPPHSFDVPRTGGSVRRARNNGDGGRAPGVPSPGTP